MSTHFKINHDPGKGVDSGRDSLPTGSIAALISIILFFCWVLLTYPSVAHWFMVPVFVCALLLWRPVGLWFRHPGATYDPLLVFSVGAVFLFVISPMILVITDYKPIPRAAPDDWRFWVGVTSAINAATLVILYWVNKNVVSKPSRKIWQFNTRRAIPLLIIALIITGAAQLYMQVRFGTSLARRQQFIETGQWQRDAFLFQTLGQAFPIFLMMFLIVLRKAGRATRQNMLPLLAVVFVYFVFDGLRGSRSATLWTLIWVVGVWHYFWRPISSKQVLAALIPLIFGFYLYGLYKSYGTKIIQEYEQSGGSLTDLSERSGRTLDQMMLVDLSRVEIQSMLLYRYETFPQYKQRTGGTYLWGSLRSFVPSQVWGPSYPKVSPKREAGTELIYGKSTTFSSLRVYSLIGEGLLNFGYLGIGIAIVAWSLGVRLVRKFIGSLSAGDARLMFAPFLTVAVILSYINDMDNLVFFFISRGALPFAMLMIICDRINRSSSSAAT